MKQSTFWAILILIGINLSPVMAGGKRQKHKTDRKKWNPYSCCHDINSLEHKPVLIVEHYLVPEFYYLDTLRVEDTSYVYECYDSRDSILNMDTVLDFETVRYISLLKNFIDYEHTYKDNNGQKRPLPVSIINKRYDKLGKDKWMSISYPSNKYISLKEFKDEIVKADTFMEQGATKNEIVLSIYKYYKVSPAR